MKKSIYKITTILGLFVFMFTFAFTVKAQEINVEVHANPSESPRPSQRPPIGQIRTTIQTNIKNRAEQNSEIRNTILDRRQEIRTDARADIKVMKGEVKAERKEMRDDMKMERKDMKEMPDMQNPSTTDMFRRGPEIKKDMAKKMQTKTFEIRKNALLKELNVALLNINNISIRIEARIVKAESEGAASTTAIRSLFTTAQAKLAKAKADVAAFQALSSTTVSTSVTASTTTEVELGKPRVIGDAAIKSVKDARDALQKVVVAIAHAQKGDRPDERPTPSVSSSISPSASVSPSTN